MIDRNAFDSSVFGSAMMDNTAVTLLCEAGDYPAFSISFCFKFNLRCDGIGQCRIVVVCYGHKAKRSRGRATPPINLVAKLVGSFGVRVSWRVIEGWKSGVVK